MRVKALEMCFVGGSRRKPGTEFDYEGKVLPRYLVAVDETVKEPVDEAAPKKTRGRGQSVQDESVSVIDFDVLAPPRDKRRQGE